MAVVDKYHVLYNQRKDLSYIKKENVNLHESIFISSVLLNENEIQKKKFQKMNPLLHNSLKILKVTAKKEKRL